MLIRCGNGANLVRAKLELYRVFSEMDGEKISLFLQSKENDLVTWKNNPPSRSYLRQVWEDKTSMSGTISIGKKQWSKFKKGIVNCSNSRGKINPIFDTVDSEYFDKYC